MPRISCSALGTVVRQCDSQYCVVSGTPVAQGVRQRHNAVETSDGIALVKNLTWFAPKERLEAQRHTSGLRKRSNVGQTITGSKGRGLSMLQQALIVVITFSIGASLGFVVSALMQDVKAADERLKSQPIPLGRAASSSAFQTS